MHLLILITGLMMFPKVYGLECHQCELRMALFPSGMPFPMPVTPERCTETVCPASQQCGAISIKQPNAGGAGVLQTKRCMAADQCITGSANVGVGRALMSSTCCSTDLCNVQYPTPPVSPSLNGKKCYSCTDPDFCFNIASCSGDEDHCISVILDFLVMNMTVKGCASKSICDSSVLSLLPTPPGSKAIESSCCEGDLCNNATSTASNGNGATSTTASLLFLVAPVISVVLFN